MSTNKANLKDQVYGYFYGTKAAIEALTGVPAGSIAFGYTTTPADGEFGSYNGTSWTWGQGGVLGGVLALSGDITPTAISADQNDYNPTGLSTATVLRLEASGANRSISGLAGGADGRIIILCNIGSTYAIYLLAESASSTAANRFALPNSMDLLPKVCLMIQYDSTTQRWRPLNSSAAALQGTPITAGLALTLSDGDILVWNQGDNSWQPATPTDPFHTHEVDERSDMFLDSEGTPADLSASSNVDGTSTYGARRDHAHQGFKDSEGNPADPAVAAADGTSTYAARRDHVHRGWVAVSKGSDEAQQDNSLSADSDLLISTDASSTYRIRGRVWFTTPAAADFKYRFRHTTAPTSLWVKHKYTAPLAAAETEQAVETASPTTTISVLSAGTVNDPGYVEFEALLITNTAGSMVFDWAQVTTTASDTKVKAGSYLEYQKVA